jgi:hypothetical protein
LNVIDEHDFVDADVSARLVGAVAKRYFFSFVTDHEAK